MGRVALESFNIVLLGENFPIATINVGDFVFNHRELKETLRLPVLLQADARSVKLQIIPDRFEAAVFESKNPLDDSRYLSAMTEQMFEYSGPKSVRAVGHNAQYVLHGTEGRKREALASLVEFDTASGLLGTKAQAGDLHLYFAINDDSRARVAILSEANDALVLDFNVNYDMASGYSARKAVGQMSHSIEQIVAIAERFEKALREA